MPCGATSIGAPALAETVSDTGPVLHLEEIGRLPALTSVSPLQFPDLVWAELQNRGVNSSSLQQAGIAFSVILVAEADGREVVNSSQPGSIQLADAQVFVLVRSSSFKALALTDDFALRSLLESHGATVVGSVGLLVRAYTNGQSPRAELDQSIEDLLNESTLHLSRAFRAYLRRLIQDL